MLHHLYTLTPPHEEEGEQPEAPSSSAASSLDDEASPSADARSPWHLAVAPGGERVGIASEDLLEVFDTTRPTAWPLCRFRLPVPSNVGRVGVHPSGASIVIADRGSVWALSRKVGDPSFAASVASDWGAAQAISFDPAGDVVWASFAEGDKHHVCALDWATRTLGIYGSLALDGIDGATHQLLFPPGRPELIAIALYHPERGSVLRLIANRGDKLEVVDDGPRFAGQLNSEPTFVAGISPDGTRLATIRPHRIEHWSWGDRDSLGSLELEQGLTFDPSACFVGEHLVALLRASADSSHRLTVFDRRLALQTNFTHRPNGAPQALLGVRALAGDRLLLVGDQRAGLFQLRAEAVTETVT